MCHTLSTVAQPVATESAPERPRAKNTATRSKARLSREQSRARIVEAATELVRERSFAELSVGEVMKRAGLERTIFYRHFDDLGDLLVRASDDAISGLLEVQVDLRGTRDDSGTHPEAVPAAIEPCVLFYERHGPLLRALDEAGASEERIASGRLQMRARFDELVADSLVGLPQFAGVPEQEVSELARALNLLNTAYLLDAFGHEPRITAATAVSTLTEIWSSVLRLPRTDEAVGRVGDTATEED